MTPVRVVVFQAPIPIPGTHRREPIFDAGDGWTLECHGDGVFRIAGHGADFFTDGFVSWVPMPPKDEHEAFLEKHLGTPETRAEFLDLKAPKATPRRRR